MGTLSKWCIYVLLILPGFIVSGTATAENKIALVVGCDYEGTGLELPSPVKDASAFADKLKSAALGFSDVTVLLNPKRGELLDAIDTFGEALKVKQGVGVFYFSGHGAQDAGTNYLIPAGARIKFVEELGDEAVAASKVLIRMQAANNGVNLMFLDACRNCELPSAKKKALQRGLSQMAGGGVLIGFAADADREALDSGSGSVYTNCLLERISEPGVSVFEMLTKVRADVRKATEGQQEPFMYAGLDQVFSFVPGKRENEEPDSPGKLPMSGGGNVAVIGEVEKHRNDPKELVRQAIVAHTAAGNAGTIAIDLFAERVDYFGRMLDRQEIVLDEIVYAFRWSGGRGYSIEGGIDVAELGGGRFSASCVKSFHTIGRGEARKGRVRGRYEFMLTNGVPLITGISGEMLNVDGPLNPHGSYHMNSESVVFAYLGAGDSASIIPQSWFLSDTVRDYFGAKGVSKRKIANEMIDYQRTFPKRWHTVRSLPVVQKMASGRYSVRLDLTHHTVNSDGHTRDLLKTGYFEVEFKDDIPRICVVKFL